LACLLVQQANCLVMDEPTNHLDMRSKKKLQDALLAYDGTLLIVSHDRAFLDPLVNKVLEVSRNGTRIFLGNVTEYLEKIEKEIAIAPAPLKSNSPETTLSAKDNRKEHKALKKKSKELEDLIQTLETSKAVLEEKMLDPEFFKQGALANNAVREHLEIEKKLEARMKEWLEVIEKLKDSSPN
jgi:ATP-binding cassette subfamily F protein 3